MRQFEPAISLRTKAIVALVSVAVSFLIYFVFDVIPNRETKEAYSLSEQDSRDPAKRIKDIIEHHRFRRYSARVVTIEQCTVIIEETATDACEKGGNMDQRRDTIDLRTLVTRVDRVRQREVEGREHRRLGWVPTFGLIEWSFRPDHAEMAAKYESEWRDLLGSERNRIGWGEVAAHEATSTFLERHPEQSLRTWERVRYCSGRRSVEVPKYDYNLALDDPRLMAELVALVDAYASQHCR